MIHQLNQIKEAKREVDSLKAQQQLLQNAAELSAKFQTENYEVLSVYQSKLLDREQKVQKLEAELKQTLSEKVCEKFFEKYSENFHLFYFLKTFFRPLLL